KSALLRSENFASEKWRAISWSKYLALAWMFGSVTRISPPLSLALVAGMTWRTHRFSGHVKEGPSHEDQGWLQPKVGFSSWPGPPVERVPHRRQLELSAPTLHGLRRA